MYVDLYVGNMARHLAKLTTLAVSKAKKRGWYPDGGNLYLQVGPNGNKSWLFRYMREGKAQVMGLGALNAVPLPVARERATEYRKLLSLDIDPLKSRKETLAKAKLKDARTMTFKQCAEAYIEAHGESWRNSKHRQQWQNTLSQYVYPVFGELPVQDIDVALVMKVLEPIWKHKTETAARIRGRIESVLDWATVREYRQGDNPARWRGHLENLLARPSKVQKVKHYSALPYREINEFINLLAQQTIVTARAMELVIYTATRTSEVIGAKWEEIDLSQKVWIIPADRMKAGREHRIPLSDPAFSILQDLKENRDQSNYLSEFVFPNQKKDRPLSNMALLALLKRLNRKDITTHGFRSSFRDWAAEQTNFPREVAETALAHTIGNKVEAAYRRGDLFEKRRQLMTAWARYCQSPIIKDTEGKVHTLAGRK